MNPYLEQPDYWSDFHNQLVAAIARRLVPQLLPKYRVVTDKWVYTVTDALTVAMGRPDVSIQQRQTNPTPIATTPKATGHPVKVRVPVPMEMQQSYLEVKDAATQIVVTVLEVLSPANKRGEGRSKYMAKRQQILGSQTHLVEIDLLRAGQPFLMEPDVAQSHYRILVSRAPQRPLADLYAFNVSDVIPAVPLPLGPEDEDVLLNVQSLLSELYEQLGYDYFIDYEQAPPMPWLAAELQPYLSKES
ncbi:hypothetical protein XM38_006760 [Halomicronema hongdechloris C2206]|nr:hypothetical protein XM38_006760 [Halomicronema hongdechloris C2206]